MREAVVAHDEGCQAIGEGVDARAGLGVGALVGPNNVETRVDARYREAVQGRVAQGKRREVVGVGELASCVSLGAMSQLGARVMVWAACLLTWCMISLRTSMGRSSSRSGPSLALSFPLGGELAVSAGAEGASARAVGASEPLSRWLSGSSSKDTAGDATRDAGDAGGGSSSSEGSGEHVVGVPGDEDGEEAMVCRDGHVSPGPRDMNAHRVHTEESEAGDSAASGGAARWECFVERRASRAALLGRRNPATARTGRLQPFALAADCCEPWERSAPGG